MYTGRRCVSVILERGLYSYVWFFADCFQRKTVSDKYYFEEKETVLMFSVKTCSRVRVLLLNWNTQAQYLLEFPACDSHSSSITVPATGAVTTGSSVSDQTSNRRLWVSKANGIISGGSGPNLGHNELVRLADGKNTENVVMAWMSTEPADKHAVFRPLPSKALLFV